MGWHIIVNPSRLFSSDSWRCSVIHSNEGDIAMMPPPYHCAFLVANGFVGRDFLNLSALSEKTGNFIFELLANIAFGTG